MLNQLSFCKIGRRNNERSNLLALAKLSEPHHGNFFDLRMLGKHALDLRGMHIEAAADDEVGSTAMKAKETCIIDRANVSRIDPTVLDAIALRSCHVTIG